MKKIRLRLKPLQYVAISFLLVIFAGAAILTSPACSAEGVKTPFFDCLFTATSAACVTGLSVVDTGTYWSLCGQIVILVLIQIGGLGAMTIISAFIIAVKRYVPLQESQLLMQSSGSLSMSAVRGLLKYIIGGTFLIEAVGAAILATQMIPCFGFWDGLFKAVFHSISAFCNAGFDVLGDYNGGSSLSAFAVNPVVNLTVIALIIIGGLGFTVWSDLVSKRFSFKKLEFHTKTVLVTTAALIIGGAVLFYIFEYNEAFADFKWYQKPLLALFQSVTPRTAGFCTVPMSELSDSGSLLTMVLMCVGGSPGSTAGGIKTTTLAVVLVSTFAYARKTQPEMFRRAIDDETRRQAQSVAAIYFIAIIAATMLICAVEPYPLKDSLFEVVSAIGTAGLSTGITPKLSTLARVILTVYMYAGRIGGMTLAILLSEKRTKVPVTRPAGKILIG